VTGLDLVELQIKIAEGYSLEDLRLTSPNSVTTRGHAIQCRLYAEDPNNNFFPCVGKVLLWKPAIIEEVRYDTAIDTNSQISVFYDPLISKIISFGDTRHTAILKLIKALQDTVILGNKKVFKVIILFYLGLKTNKRFLIEVLAHEAFANGYFDTHFIQSHFPDSRLKAVVRHSDDSLIAAFLWDWLVRIYILSYSL
jgi:acetyl/propionyl-CoA carboxylase alpha subunit